MYKHVNIYIIIIKGDAEDSEEENEGDKIGEDIDGMDLHIYICKYIYKNRYIFSTHCLVIILLN
jgi:hypothetical protein